MDENGGMPTYRDQAVVLRTHKLGEADRILTLLSRRHGKIRAVARGVRRTSSKFGGRLEPFSHVDLQFASGRTLDVVTQAVTLHAFSEPLGTDYGRYTTGQVILETADRLVAEEREPALQQYLLIVGALNALASGSAELDRSPTMIMDSYLLRAVAIAGYAPTLTDCARCGASGPHDAFVVQLGGVVCRTCRPPGAAWVRPGVTEYLAALLTGDWVSAGETDDLVRRAGSGLVSAFASWHLERGLRSLNHVER